MMWEGDERHPVRPAMTTVNRADTYICADPYTPTNRTNGLETFQALQRKFDEQLASLQRADAASRCEPRLDRRQNCADE